MKTYKITGQTNGWIAQRDSKYFKGKEYVTIHEGLSLREAQKILLDMFNEDYDKGYQNWGLACRYSLHCSATYKDGTRSYDHDSRYYYIEEEQEPEE